MHESSPTHHRDARAHAKAGSSFQIAGRSIGPEQPAWIIAEIGVNHDGDLKRALELIDLAATAGADAVKFQVFDSARLAAPQAPTSDYQRAEHLNQRSLLESLQLQPEWLPELRDAATSRDLVFFASPFDERSLEWVLALEPPVIKLGSGELTNVPLLRRVASTGLPLLLSTGMADWAEIEAALDLVAECTSQRPILLHCVTSYPTPLTEANVRAVSTLAARSGCLVGYSDHTEELEPSLAARALGACVLERHLTYDRDASGPDHRTSLEGKEFGAWVASIRRLEVALGSGEKRHHEIEEEGRRKARKSIVAVQPIAPDECITAAALSTQRVGRGLSASHWDSVVGTRAQRRIEPGEVLERGDFL